MVESWSEAPWPTVRRVTLGLDTAGILGNYCSIATSVNLRGIVLYPNSLSLAGSAILIAASELPLISGVLFYF